MYNQGSYQLAYANFVMDQHQAIPSTSQDTSQQNNSNPIQQNNGMENKKPVRTRISFSHPQQIVLETEFQGSPYLHKSRRIETANRLGIEEKQVKVWFQNRRMKWKREALQNGVAIPHSSVKYRHGTLKKPALHQVQQQVQQQRPKKLVSTVQVHHQLQQQPPEQPMHQVPVDTTQVSTLTVGTSSEESVDLDRYLNDLERRVEALRSNQQNDQQNDQQNQQEQHKQHQPIELNFDGSLFD